MERYVAGDDVALYPEEQLSEMRVEVFGVDARCESVIMLPWENDIAFLVC